MQATVDIPYPTSRDRGTVAIRILMAIPHLIVMSLWNYAAEIVAVIHWFVCVITGRRNQGMWSFCNGYLGYATRTMTYVGLMHDEFPPFGTDQGSVPVRYDLQYDESVNRLTVGLRLIWAIPALLISAVLVLVGEILTIISWFAILFTGTMPSGMYNFLCKVHRYVVQTNAYVLLLTDTYPVMPAA